MKDQKTQLVSGLCTGLLVAVAFYLLLTFIGDGSVAIPEKDTRIYLQYARNIAQGQPYVYSDGDAPSTGSTSHSYPFLLAALYKLGATGDRFITATYFLNASFYLGIIALVWLIARKVAGKAAPLALFLTLLSGQLASAVLRMTDIGWFTFLALSLVACLLYSKYWIALLMILLCSVTRPEGFIFSVAFLTCGSTALIMSGKKHNQTFVPSRKQIVFFLLYGLAGISAFLAMLLVNYILTGHAQFMSVAEKGYFNIYPFYGAIGNTLEDLLKLLKGLIFGLGEGSRQYYLFPLLGGLFGLSGIFLHRRRDQTPKLFEYWLLLSAGAAILLVSSSEWQGVSNDRYLAWIMPFWYIYIAMGVMEISDRLKSSRFAYACITLLIGFQMVSLAYMATDAFSVAVETEKEKSFGKQIRETVPVTERFGAIDGMLLNYYLPEQKVYNILGITSPDFFDKDSHQQMNRIVDLLRHRPELRFENWILRIDEANARGWVKPFIGSPVLLDTDSSIMGSSMGYGVYKADWSTLDGGDLPILLEQTEHLTLVDKIDIGYLPDERNHRYTCTPRLKNMRIPMMVTTSKLGDHDYSENGRVVIGSESFTANGIRTGFPLWVALRTGCEAEVSVFLGKHYTAASNITFGENPTLRILVDGREISAPFISARKEGFSEVLFEIPASFILTDSPTLEVIGDHISYAYWLYQ